MNIKEIRIEDFDYMLPDERIAKYPLAERDHSNLLHWKNGEIEKVLPNKCCQVLPRSF